jgi:hypothetical protein
VRRHEALRQLSVLHSTSGAGDTSCAPSTQPLSDVLQASALLAPLLAAAEAVVPPCRHWFDTGLSVFVGREPECRVAFRRGLCGAAIEPVSDSRTLKDSSAPQMGWLDDRLSLPLEIEAAHAAGLLVGGHPRSMLACCSSRARQAGMPISAMVLAGDLDAVQWLCAEGWRCDVDCSVACAAGRGHVHVLEWLLARPDVSTMTRRHVFCAAAKAGQLHVLQWATAEWRFIPPCMTDAAAGGHLHVVRWLVEAEPAQARVDTVCCFAAGSGPLAVLQLLQAHGWPVGPSTLHAAVAGGHVPVLRWLRSQDPPCPWRGSVVEWAVIRGHTAVLACLLELGCVLDEAACSVAVAHCNLNVLRWLRSLDPPCP